MRELTIEESKPMLVDMMLFFHEYCEKYDLKYFLTGGTLLGAVRHEGFIPWDDDIDLNIPRYDYEKLLNSFNENTNGRYKIISSRDSNYYLPSAKLIDTTTVMKENCDTNMEIGLFIDLFPMDNLSDDITKAKNMFKMIKKYRDSVMIKNILLNKNRSLRKNIILFFAKFILIPLKRSFLLKKIDEKSRKYENSCMSKYVGTVATGIYGEREILKREWFESRKLVKFEGQLFYAPIGYKELLTQLYGNYMKLPPKEQQITHHDNIVWLKEEISIF